METHTFKLISGVECEVGLLMGIHQRYLTQDKNIHTGKGVNLLLQDIIKRLGSKATITAADVDNLLSADRKKILKEARMFALDYEPKFDFTYEWKSDDNKVSRSEHSVLFDDTDFNERPYMMYDEKGGLIPLSVPEYDQINKFIRITLPKSGKIVEFKMLDGAAELAGSKVLKKDRSSHTPLLMRNPQYIEETEKGADKKAGERKLLVDLDRLAYKDIEHLRGEIKKVEGEIETLLVIDHPKTDEQATIDIVLTPAFFFPSLALL